MGLRIRTNISALNAQRNLSNVTDNLSNHMGKLSSGLRINRAADDAAGLGISEKMRSKVAALGQAKRNTADGISLIQTAEGGLDVISNILIRLKELSVQAASDTIGPQERDFIQEEFQSLKHEIDRIAYSSTFNDIPLLIGNTPPPEGLDKNYNKPPLDIQVGDKFFPQYDSLEANKDLGTEPINIIRINIDEINALTTGEGSLNLGGDDDENEVRVDTKESAQHSMSRLDSAIEKISGYRADLGALQNRLESTIRNTANQIENLASAESQIRDADYAFETSEAAKYKMLEESGVAVLMHANQIPELALRLLG